MCVCKRGGDIFFFFSVCIPGNRSAALLNNETSAYMYVCVCGLVGEKKTKNNDTRFSGGRKKKVQVCLVECKKRKGIAIKVAIKTVCLT